MTTMQNTRVQSLQDPFLNALRRQRVPVSIYLTNGIKLQGQVDKFDRYCVLLKNNTKQIVFKHAIATIVPSRNIIFNEDTSSAEGNQSLHSNHALQAEEDDQIENF